MKKIEIIGIILTIIIGLLIFYQCVEHKINTIEYESLRRDLDIIHILEHWGVK